MRRGRNISAFPSRIGPGWTGNPRVRATREFSATLQKSRHFESDDIIEQAKFPGLLVVLDGIEDPHNLGAILRSAEAAQADGVFLPQHRSAGLSPAVVKASAGRRLARQAGARFTNVSRLIECLEKARLLGGRAGCRFRSADLGSGPDGPDRPGPRQRGERTAQTCQRKV